MRLIENIFGSEIIQRQSLRHKSLQWNDLAKNENNTITAGTPVTEHKSAATTERRTTSEKDTNANYRDENYNTNNNYYRRRTTFETEQDNE